MRASSSPRRVSSSSITLSRWRVFQVVANQRGLSRAGLAQGEQVEAGTGDAGAKCECGNGARLPQHFASIGRSVEVSKLRLSGSQALLTSRAGSGIGFAIDIYGATRRYS